MNVLYKEIKDRCQARIDNGEKYCENMWFEEAAIFTKELRKEGLLNSAYALEQIIYEQKVF